MTVSAEERPASTPPNDAAPTSTPPLTFRQWVVAMLLALGFLGGTALAVRNIELITGRYVVTGVPPIPAVLSLLLLTAAQKLAERLPLHLWARWRVDRRQILLVFAMVCVGSILNGAYMVRAFLPHLVSLQYWQTHNNAALSQWVRYLPSWYAPADAEAIRRYFEGSRGMGGVPWGLWIAPLLRWSLFFAAVYAVGWSMMALVRRQWLHAERLSFPLLYLPLTFSAEDGGSLLGGRPIWRNPVFWGGFAISAVFNGFNIGHALVPTIPAPGFDYTFQGQFPQEPWTPFNTLMLFFMPEAIGFGYFLPLEVSFSTWFFYLLLKFGAVAGIAAGMNAPGFPYMKEQSAGAYLGVALLLLWGARRHLAGILRQSFRRGAGPRSPDDREERTALYVFIGGVLFLLGWCGLAGFSLWITVPFFGVLFCFVLVYCRIRAETGIPYEFTYPYGLPKDLVVNTMSPDGALALGGPKSWVLLSTLAWLSRHHYAEGVSAYTIDGMKLAEEGRIGRKWLYGGLAVAFAAGLGLAFWSHLGAYYQVGANLSNGGKMEYRTSVALQEFQQMASTAASHTPRDSARLVAELLGGGFALGLGVLRLVWLKCPFHPLGYILATAYGDHTTNFFAMLIAWTAKVLVLKAGGLSLYRRGIPFFLGLILGHYLIGGVLWPCLGLFLTSEATNSYHIFLGG